MSYKVGTIINRNYTYNGNLYTAKITFKRMRNIVLRLGKEENALKLSAPYYSSMDRIDKMVKDRSGVRRRKRARDVSEKASPQGSRRTR